MNFDSFTFPSSPRDVCRSRSHPSLFCSFLQDSSYSSFERQVQKDLFNSWNPKWFQSMSARSQHQDLLHLSVLAFDPWGLCLCLNVWWPLSAYLEYSSLGLEDQLMVAAMHRPSWPVCGKYQSFCPSRHRQAWLWMESSCSFWGARLKVSHHLLRAGIAEIEFLRSHQRFHKIIRSYLPKY